MKTYSKDILSEENLAGLKSWFHQYVRLFYSDVSIVHQAIVLKEEHSKRVCDEILGLCEKLDLSDNDTRIAEAIALFHDIGRFEQYTRYQTFVDKKSENHGELGVRVLRKENVLAALDDSLQSLILTAISNHNRLSIPKDESPVSLFFSRLIRDADKLEIFNLVSTYYYVDHAERSAAIELDLPDIPLISEDVLNCLEQGAVIKSQQLKSLNDFKLLQMAWIYDINFQPSFQRIFARDYLGKIRNTLPASEKIDQIYTGLLSYLEKRI